MGWRVRGGEGESHESRGILDGSFFFTIWMPFLALTQMVVYVLPCLIPFQCASAPGEKRKRKRGEGEEKGGEKKGGKKKRYLCRFDPPTGHPHP